MGIVYYGVCFVMLLIAFGIIINGWFAITRGEWEYLPDGTRRKKGNIFKAWYFYWMQETIDKEWIRYEGSELQIMHKRLIGLLGQSSIVHCENTIIFEEDKRYHDKIVGGQPKQSDYIEHVKAYIKDGFGLETQIYSEESGLYGLRLYKVYPVYVYPEWVRKMMASCITCHSSVYGTILFVGFHCLVNKNLLHGFMYAAFPYYHYWPAMILTWVVMLFALSYINTVLWKKIA